MEGRELVFLIFVFISVSVLFFQIIKEAVRYPGGYLITVIDYIAYLVSYLTDGNSICDSWICWILNLPFNILIGK